MKSLFIIVVLFLPCLCISDTGSTSLKLVQVVYRHGDRSPVEHFPTDVYNLSTWKQFGAIGFDQLTWLGMKEHYELGQFFKKRYIDDKEVHLLGPKYDPRELYVRSTDIDRTLMSAYSNLAGMFPPTGNTSPWNVNNTIKWQPIPVHTVDNSEDLLLNQIAPCPKGDQLYLQEQETDRYKSMQAKYKDLMSNVTKWSGTEHQDLVSVWKITDSLTCELAHDLDLPNWTRELWPPGNSVNQTVYDVLMYLRGWEIGEKYGEPRENAKIRGGPLIKKMLENANKTINKTDTMTKFYMYSSHDTTISAVMKALQVFNHLQPPFASAIMFELHQDNTTKDYTVRLLYKNETDKFYPLQLPGCAKDCPISKFVSLTADMIPNDISKLCAIPDKPESNEALVIGLGIGAGILLLLVMIGIVYIIRKKRGDARFADYYHVESS